MSKPANIKIEDYNAIQSSEEASLIPKASTQNAPKKKKKRKKYQKVKSRPPKSCWKLIMNLNFLFFAVNCVTPIALFGWWYMLRPNATIPYIIAGVLGLLVSVTGFRHFKSIMALTTAANKFSENNIKFRNEHSAIRKDVSKIQKANKHLRNTHVRLAASNKQNLVNLTNFREVQTVMKQLNIQDFKSVTSKAQRLGNTWHTELLQKERNMLHLIFDRYEMNHDNHNGMTKAEFTKFAQCLPETYQRRFARLGTFDKLSNNKGVLEYSDFEMVLDVFAEMVVDDVDIDLQIVKETSANNGLASPNDLASPQDSFMTDYGSDSDEEDMADSGGFLTKLSTWRKTKKQDRIRHSANVSRNLVVQNRTPTPNGRSGSKYGAFSGFDFEEKEDKDLLDAKPQIKVLKKTVSTINATHNIDDMSIGDDEINAYMARQQQMGSAINLDMVDEHR